MHAEGECHKMPILYNRNTKEYSDRKQPEPKEPPAPPQPLQLVSLGKNERLLPKTEQEKGQLSLAGVVMAGFGFLLCLTGIGAILGIPIIIAAVSNSRREMAEPNHIFEAPCPYCDTLLHVPVNLLGSNCPACAKRFIVRDGEFLRIE
jgi:hypothetical protein